MRRRWLLTVSDGERRTHWRFRATRQVAERLLALLTSSSRWRAGVLDMLGD